MYYLTALIIVKSLYRLTLNTIRESHQTFSVDLQPDSITLTHGKTATECHPDYF